MVRTAYEPLPFAEAAFPVIFHLDNLQHPVEAHWHEGIELLFCLEGTAEVVADTEKLTLRPGELTIINSGRNLNFNRLCFFLFTSTVTC